MRVFLKETEGKNGSTYLRGYTRSYGRSVEVLVFKASGNGVNAVANVIVKNTRPMYRPMMTSYARRRRMTTYRRRTNG
jgi:hypothetical protein